MEDFLYLCMGKVDLFYRVKEAASYPIQKRLTLDMLGRKIITIVFISFSMIVQQVFESNKLDLFIKCSKVLFVYKL